MDDVRRLPVGEDNQIAITLDEPARAGARPMIGAALKAEADEYVERFAGERDEHCKRLVVRNGRARERRVTVGSGTVAIQAPLVDERVDEDTGERQRFRSRILPAYARRSPKVNDVLPCSTCAVSPRATSARRWSSCSARRGARSSLLGHCRPRLRPMPLRRR